MQGQYIQDLLSIPDMLRMGHFQRREDLNLGLGWIYYALARVIRPARAVVIGSYRGFVPSILAKSMIDNMEGGEVIFIDPSYVDDFWADATRVENYFRQLGTPNVRHYRHTTQQFMATQTYSDLADIGLLMIDGLHTAEQARLDYLAFLGKLTKNGVALFHDSVGETTSRMYGKDRLYTRTVCVLMERLRMTPGLEIFTLPYASGVTMVKGQPETLDFINRPFDSGPTQCGPTITDYADRTA